MTERLMCLGGCSADRCSQKLKTQRIYLSSKYYPYNDLLLGALSFLTHYVSLNTAKEAGWLFSKVHYISYYV